MRLANALLLRFVSCCRNEYKHILPSVCSNKFRRQILHHCLLTVFCHLNALIINETIRHAQH